MISARMFEDAKVEGLFFWADAPRYSVVRFDVDPTDKV